MHILLLSGATATSSAPTAATDGVNLRRGGPGTVGKGIREEDSAALVLTATGTGALTFQGRIWVYSPRAAKWLPLGTSTTIADRGKLNQAATITGSDTLEHAELIQGLSCFTRVCLQVTTITGTNCSVTVALEVG